MEIFGTRTTVRRKEINLGNQSIKLYKRCSQKHLAVADRLRTLQPFLEKSFAHDNQPD